MQLSPNGNLHHLLETLIAEAYSSEEQPRYQSAGAWWKACWEQESLLPPDQLQQLILLAFQAPNFSCAFVAAYQTALRLMFPHLQGKDNVACLCVSEKAGNSPKAIECYLKEHKISGEKSFVTCSAEVDTLLIMLDDQDASLKPNQKKNLISSKKLIPPKSLRLVQIDNAQNLRNAALSLNLSPFNAEKFLPDIGKGSLILNDFPIIQANKLAGDAHEAYSKPFSVLEGLCIRLAMCSHLLKWASVYQWPKALQADLVLQISALENALRCSPHSALTQVVIDAQNRLMETLISSIDEQAENHAQFKAHWQRDKICLYMDFRLRAKRLDDAWLQLASASKT